MAPLLTLLLTQVPAPAPAQVEPAHVREVHAREGRVFPAWVTSREIDVVELHVDPHRVDELAALDTLTLQGFPWGAGLDLELEQEPIPVRADALHVNGVPTPSLAREGASFWSGHVAGELESDAFLAFAGGATWGWVRHQGELVHVISVPGEGRDWAAGKTLLVTEEGLRVRGLENRRTCGAELLPENADVIPPGAQAATAAVTPEVLLGTLALETDYQYYQIFGNLAVAEGYSMALLAAGNLRYHQFDVHMKTIYMGFHTTPADPWSTPDNGSSNCFDLLYEFQAAWMNDGAPVDAHLNHIFSGVNLGCGVAFLDAVCDDVEGFSVMSNMNGDTPFPVVAGPLNWDFVWMAHELGHNFGSPHTHQYCPPIDECSPMGFWGPCQDEIACINQAGLMSYCHACPGGMTNFTTWFHPVAARTMRLASQASCMPPAMVSIR